ncbi:MAG: BON domain-containing protein [Polyangiaceae bacterium]
MPEREGSGPARRTDDELQASVQAELRWSKRVRATDVGVIVRDAVVTLTGEVDSWAARLAANEAAHRVDGVLDVANEIVVNPPDAHVRTDADIAHAVRMTLVWDVLVPDEKIRSTVTGGVVTLEGTVESYTEREDAHRAIQNVVGVRAVRDEIVVEPTLLVPPQRLREAVREAIAQRASGSVREVTVDVTGADVKLGGVVPTSADRLVVEGAAKSVSGVRSVESALRVEPRS